MVSAVCHETMHHEMLTYKKSLCYLSDCTCSISACIRIISNCFGVNKMIVFLPHASMFLIGFTAIQMRRMRCSFNLEDDLLLHR